MSRGLKLLLLLCAVPVIAIASGIFVQSKLQNTWVEAISEEFGAEAAQQVLPIKTLCTIDPEFRGEFSSVCFEISAAQWMIWGAIIALVLGFALMAGIKLAGRSAGNQRELLWKIFGPGLKLTVVGLIGIIALHAALAMAAIWFGEAALIGRVHIQAMLLIGLGAISGIWSMSKASLAAVREVTSDVLGRPLSRQEEPELWSMVEGVAAKLGTEPPHNIVAGIFPTFYVTEANVAHPKGLLSGRTLYLSLPLCRVLTQGELAAIVGHELGHFRGDDTAFSQKFYPIFRGSEEALIALVSSSGGARSIALSPAIHTLGFFLESFATAEATVSREREFLADQAGAQAAGVGAMASALAKVHAYCGMWEPLIDELNEQLGQGHQVANVSRHFAEYIQQKAEPSALEGLDEQKVSHPTDSHPPLSQRLAALGSHLGGVSEAALQVAPAEAAIGLFSRPDAWEEEVTSLSMSRGAEEA